MAAHLNEQVLEDLLTGPDGPVVRHITGICRAVRNEAVRNMPTDTGQGKASMDFVVIVRDGTVVGIVGSSLFYLEYVHGGTGIYGPRKALIRPVSAKALKFMPKRGGAPQRRGARSPAPGKRGPFVFAKWSRGQPPNPFLVDALNTVMGR